MDDISSEKQQKSSTLNIGTISVGLKIEINTNFGVLEVQLNNNINNRGMRQFF